MSFHLSSELFTTDGRRAQIPRQTVPDEWHMQLENSVGRKGWLFAEWTLSPRPAGDWQDKLKSW